MTVCVKPRRTTSAAALSLKTSKSPRQKIARLSAGAPAAVRLASSNKTTSTLVALILEGVLLLDMGALELMRVCDRPESWPLR